MVRLLCRDFPFQQFTSSDSNAWFTFSSSGCRDRISRYCGFMKAQTTIDVQLSEDRLTATVRMSSRSTPIICGVLAVEQNEAGERELYLDTRIHRTIGGDYTGWEPRGAISTILRQLL